MGPLLLFAEDDHEDWMLISEMFSEHESPNQLERVVDGSSLLDRLRKGALPDMIFLDLKMPKMSGHDVLHAIRSNHSWRHIPVVIMTSSLLEADVYKSYYGGANSYVPKPVTEDALKVLWRFWGSIVRIPKV